MATMVTRTRNNVTMKYAILLYLTVPWVCWLRTTDQRKLKKDTFDFQTTDKLALPNGSLELRSVIEQRADRLWGPSNGTGGLTSTYRPC